MPVKLLSMPVAGICLMLMTDWPLSMQSQQVAPLLRVFPEARAAPDKILTCSEFYVMLQPFLYKFLSYGIGLDEPFEDLVTHFGVHFPRSSEKTVLDKGRAGLSDILTAATHTSRINVGEWQTSLKPWSILVEAVRKTWGEGPRAYCLAAIAAGIMPKEIRSTAEFDRLHDTKLPLVERARYARRKATFKYWNESLLRASSNNDLFLVLMLLLSYAPSIVLKGLAAELNFALADFDSERWHDLVRNLELITSITNPVRQPQPLRNFSECDLSAALSPRLKTLLMQRLSRPLRSRILIEQLESHDGNDLDLGWFLARQGLDEAHSAPEMWKYVVAFVKKYDLSILDRGGVKDYSQHRFYYGHIEKMPVLIAKEVVAAPANFPVEILEVAEWSLSQRLGVSADPLEQVALKEKWYA